MRNNRVVQSVVGLMALLLAACGSVALSRSGARTECDVTPEALARIRYKVDASRSTRVEIDCAACDAVYVAAQHEWLRKTYPGRMWVEHFSANRLVGSPESERDESCFRMPTPTGGQETICFTNSEQCDGETS